MAKIKKVIHFRKKCIGCGMCELLATNYFEMSKIDGLATLIDGVKNKDTIQKKVMPGDEELIAEAAENCPVKIIRLL